MKREQLQAPLIVDDGDSDMIGIFDQTGAAIAYLVEPTGGHEICKPLAPYEENLRRAQEITRRFNSHASLVEAARAALVAFNSMPEAAVIAYNGRDDFDVRDKLRKALQVNNFATEDRLVKSLYEALKMNMEWIGPPPTDAHSFDSLREDAWKKGKAALQLAEAGARHRTCANCGKVTKHRPATECWNCKQPLAVASEPESQHAVSYGGDGTQCVLDGEAVSDDRVPVIFELDGYGMEVGVHFFCSPECREASNPAVWNPCKPGEQLLSDVLPETVCENCGKVLVAGEAVADGDDGLEMHDNSCGECGHPYKVGDETHYPECSRLSDDEEPTATQLYKRA